MPDVSTTKKIALGADTIVDYDKLLDETTANATYLALDGGEMTGDLALHTYRERHAGFATTTSFEVDFQGKQVQGNSGTTSGTIDVMWTNVPSSSSEVRSVTIVLDFPDASAVTWPSGTKFPDGEPPDLQEAGESWLVAVANDGEVAVFLSGKGMES